MEGAFESFESHNLWMKLNVVEMLQELGKQYTLHALGQDEGGIRV